MIHNYYYRVARGFQIIDDLKSARALQKHIIKEDRRVCLLYRDNEGYYILKEYMDGRPSKIIR